MDDRNIAMAVRIAQRAAELGGTVYYVGGFVRDRLRGAETKDVDIEVHGLYPAQLEAILDELGEIVSGTDSVEGELDHKELLRDINGFLNSISEYKRGIFIRRYWYSDRVSDIAKRYGKSENSVSVELNRIRKKLSDHLLKRGYEL